MMSRLELEKAEFKCILMHSFKERIVVRGSRPPLAWPWGFSSRTVSETSHYLLMCVRRSVSRNPIARSWRCR